MLWADTTNGILKIRNSANNAWIELLQLDGTLTMEDGAEATPGLAFRDDLNTGIWSSAADTFNISAGGTERLELGAATVFNESGADVDFRIEGDTQANLFFVDAGKDEIYLQGQLGIGTTDTPGEIGLYLGDGTNPAAHIYANGGDHLYILANAYFAGGWKYQGSGEAGSLTIGSGNLTFNTAPTGSGGNAISWNEVFQAKNSNGDLSITNGNLVLANGKGIDFSDTAAGSGASNVSELLDDYEHGSFTPTLSEGTSDSPTYSSQLGGYVKIGKKVYFQFYMIITGATGNGNHMKFGGLPFTAINDTTYGYGGAFVTYQISMFDKGEDISFHIGINDTKVKVYDSTGTKVDGNSSVVNDLTTHIALSGFYLAA